MRSFFVIYNSVGAQKMSDYTYSLQIGTIYMLSFLGIYVAGYLLRQPYI